MSNWPSRSTPAKIAQVSIFADVFDWAMRKKLETISMGQMTVFIAVLFWKLEIWEMLLLLIGATVGYGYGY